MTAPQMHKHPREGMAVAIVLLALLACLLIAVMPFVWTAWLAN